MVTGMALMMAMTSFGSVVRIPFYPVPISLQSIFPLIAGVFFPPGAAALTQAGYVSLGLLGLPLFSQGGGMAYLLKPTFGYLLAMPFTAAGVSWGLRQLSMPASVRSLVVIMAAGALFLLVFGTLWLYFSFNWVAGKPLPLAKAFSVGLVLFLPVEALKVAVAILVGRKYQTLVQR
jgi:biotin transport system substrate-specific component